MKRRTAYNPKRQIAPRGLATPEQLSRFEADVRYAGNPEHKRAPGDFGLTPPSHPRPGKTLCDEAGVTSRGRATELLVAGIRRGLVSLQERNGWPQNIWSVAGEEVFESQLENPQQGTYHGYPLPLDDPFRKQVLAEWHARQP